jgi:hypothetical protein
MKKIISLLIVFFFLGIGYYFYSNDVTEIKEQELTTKFSRSKPHKIPNQNAIKPEQVKALKTSKNPKFKKSKPLNEKESLTAYSNIMFQFSNPKRNKEELITILNEWNLKPLLKEDSNEDTGSMTIVRTEKTLPGTRYFHAQYFSDSNGQTLQHLSFEFKPGPLAMKQAISVIQQEFKIQSKPTMKKDGFISWNKDDRYTVWIKKLTAEDLKDDPFNAYSPLDVGTIRVAMELEIHDHYEGHQEKENGE